MVLEPMQTHPLWDSAPGQQLQRHQLHVGSGGSNANGVRAEPVALLLLDPSPTCSTTKEQSWLPHPGEYLRLCPLQRNRCTKMESKQLSLIHRNKQTQGGCQMEETKKYGPNERIDQISRKRTKQNGDTQPIKYRVQNTGDQDAQRTH